MPPKVPRARASSATAGQITSPVFPAMTSDPISFSSIDPSASSATITSASEADPIVRTQIPSNSRTIFADEDLLDLNTGNYRKWSKRIYNILALHGDLNLYLSLGYVCPDRLTRTADARNWLHNDRHVQAYIRVCCTENETDQIDGGTSPPTTSATLWERIVRRHLNRGTHSQVFRLRDLLQLTMDPTKPLQPQANRAARLCVEIVAMGPLDAEALTKVAILNMLRVPFPGLQSQLADQISRSTKENPFTSDDIMNRLELESELSAEAAAAIAIAAAAASGSGLRTDVALSAQAAPSRRDIICSNCKRKGHPVSECFQPGGAAESRKQEILERIASRRRGGPSSTKSAKTLYDGQGRAYHLAEVTAPAPKPVESANAAVVDPRPALLSDNPDAAWLAEHDDHIDCSYSASLALSAPLSTSVDWALNSVSSQLAAGKPEPFLFDSGASTHISPLRSDFATFETISPQGIRGVNGSVIYAVGVGKIKLAVGRGKHLVLERALFVPGATVRLISVRALCDGPHAYSVDFSASGVSVKNRGGAEFFSGLRVGRGLYALAGPAPSVTSALVATSATPTLETWHRRLGHANYRATLAVASRVRSTGTPINTSSVPPKCASCIVGKQTRTPVPKVREGVRSNERGATFFVDAAGDQCTVSASGNVAPLDIIDDFSSYGWSFPVPSRAHCAPRLRDFLVARRAEGCPVRRIVMDRGECLTNDIRAVCATLGVLCETTASYTSAQNGKVERVHRTYMGKARAMRLSTSVPESRWDEFYVTACYLTNRTPTSALPNGITPYEAWFGTPPSLSHLREIGCRAFVLVNTHNPKIRARSFECVLIGYALSSKGYRCYHAPTHRVLESFHVSFIESHECPPTSPPPPSLPTPSPSWSDDPPFSPSISHTCPPPPASLLPVATPSLPSSPIIPSPAPLDPALAPFVPPASIAPVTVSGPVTAPRRTMRLTERAAAAAGLPFVTSLERAVADVRASADRIRSARPQLDPSPPEESTDIDSALTAALQLDGDYDGDPTSLREALASPFARQWTAAIHDEFGSIKEMQVYVLVPRAAVPSGRRIMQGKLVFRLKRDENGDPARFKARWVVRGFQAVFGQDYHRTTSPTMRMESFRLLLHLAASLGWDVLQVDVKTAFLYGKLPPDELCYMEQPKGFEEVGLEDHVWELHKGLYGMPQGGRTWNRTMHEHLTSVGFSRVDSEYCLYIRTSSVGTVITGVHVDDFIAIASSKSAGDLFKADLRRAWTISDLGEAKFCIGIAIDRDRATRSIRISQTALIDRIISQFNLTDAFPVSTPMVFGEKLSRSQAASTDEEKRAAATLPYRALVGSLNYIAVGSRPDISFAVQQLAQFLDNYGSVHWEAAKRVVRYLKGSRDLSLTLGGDRAAYILGYSDSDWAGCVDTRRSTGGYCFSLGSGMISWSARKQPTPADSSTEAEYMAAAEAGKECVWLRSVLTTLGFAPDAPSPLLVDNRSAIVLSGDPSFHSRSKHIGVKHHLLRHYTNTDQICVLWIPTKDNIADIFTKALPGPQYTVLRRYLGLI